MKAEVYSWNEKKNQLLKAERNVSFEDIVAHVMAGDLLDVIDHPNTEKYPGQQVLIVKMHDYAWLVPYVQEGNEAFLKTIIPSRKATKKYIGEKHAEL